MKRIARAAFVVLVISACLIGRPPLAAESYPSRPIHLLIPFAAGGANDTVGRILANDLQDRLKQPVIVENVSGGGGVIATNRAARATPDGYTLLVTTAGHAITASSPNLPYEAIADFAPVSLLANGPLILAANPKRPYKDVQELIAAAKANPGSINFASAGPGSTSHLAAELFKIMTGTNIVHVPYRGGAPAMLDTVAGVTQLWWGTTPSALPQVQAGNLRALGVTTSQRTRLADGMPTIAEQGVPGYEVNYWVALLAPARTPPEIIGTLNKAVALALRDPAVEKQFDRIGFEPAPSTPEALGALLRREVAKWGDVVRKAGLHL